MVINIGALKSHNYALVYNDIRAVIDASPGKVVKVILETVFLSEEEKIAGSVLAAEAGAAFVKTCTGFSGGGASIGDVVFMKKAVSYKEGVKVKASAGIRSREACLEMLQAGADRIGTCVDVHSLTTCHRLLIYCEQVIGGEHHARSGNHSGFVLMLFFSMLTTRYHSEAA